MGREEQTHPGRRDHLLGCFQQGKKSRGKAGKEVHVIYEAAKRNFVL